MSARSYALTQRKPPTLLLNDFTGKFACWPLTIQEFDPIFHNIPGKANAAADALSRNIALVSTITNEPIIPTAEELKTRQRSNPFCASLIYYLESSVYLFFLQNDPLYNSSSVSPCDTN